MDTRPAEDSPARESGSSDFIRSIIDSDNQNGTYQGRVHTRFPPEPNGYLHIGHAKSIVLNFGIAEEYGGKCNLRFDDTNPEKEELEYIESIQQDVRWLGFDWEDRLYYASDYFEQLYQFAERLTAKGLAYVDELSADQIRETRGTPTQAGTDSPYRERPIAENLDLLRRMRDGEFADGSRVLRARIDMAAANINLRDPIMYRIRRVHHPNTGDSWCIYPTYDWAHGQSDWIEGITHSICTLEFENHRPLYDWFLDALEATPPKRPRQIEFARLNLGYTVMSKRRLLELVREGRVSGWDDPRMPTICGMRRRGYTPEAIRSFCRAVGVSKTNSQIDLAMLEFHLREDLNKRAPRVMAVLDPLKVVIENYPEAQVEQIEAQNNPEDPAAGNRTLPFSREIYIEREDFREDPPKKFFRLAPGREVRLKHSYYITCNEVIKDPSSGEVIELRCSYDPQSRGGSTPDGRKVKGTLHWVSAPHAVEAEVRLYDRLFSVANPSDDAQREGVDYRTYLNPESLRIMQSCKVEPSLREATVGTTFQFLRHGYFCVDLQDGSAANLVFNRAVSLRDSWAKIERAEGGQR
ncbi:MAG: glutamine--tRNA ligase/YqeY domain fusion protein [Spirochaetaceae bacterium]|nr:MAG: glutamine--tRNA ligase/YqeY domain fusion protein [Spirochaetaceae bacterium]